MAPPTNEFDLIVIGLGAMGAATTYQARRRGLRVLGIDRYDPPHTFGSTHAETRVTRLAVGEGEQYLPLVRRSHEIWQELEARSGETLFHRSGGLIITEQASSQGQRWHDFVTETDRIARSAGIEFTVLGESDVVPTPLVPSDDCRIGFEPSAGLVMAERAVATQLTLARTDGATIRTGERVTAVAADSNGVDVTTDSSRYRAAHVVVSAGPWGPELVDRELASHMRVTRQVVYWFEVEDPGAYRTDSMPWVIWVGRSDDEYLGVFPIPPGGTPALKVLGEQFVTATTPDQVERRVSPAEIDAFYHQNVKHRVRGVRPVCVKAEVCLYTNTPDDHFLIDASPSSDLITVMSPCSGHGFKHSAALGEAVATQVASGEPHPLLIPFRRDRLSSALP